jgi:hypothetical protein
MSQTEFDQMVATEFQKLPKVVQEAISAADVQKHLRALSQKHQLHLDQWSALENEVMMIVIGMDPTDALEANIIKEVGLAPDVARNVANDINTEVFEPIRKKLESTVAENAPAPLVEEADPTQLASERAPEVTVPKVVEPPPPKATPTEVTLSHLKSSPDVGIAHEAPAASTEPKAKRGSLDAGTAPAHATIPRQSDPYREPLA